jgi:hypothetical protein
LSCLLSYTLLGDLNFTANFVLGAATIISATAVYARASHYEKTTTSH